jgi:peptidoglycan L-alanyl-D-glutamate endopeptidase CwlK
LHSKIQPLALDFLRRCREAQIDILVICTLRSLEEQATLYAQGRTAPGAKVTNAKPGTSAHNYGLALDVVPLVNGKPDWNFDPRNVSPIWAKVGELGQAAGLEWFGTPGSPFPEGCHFQLHNWRELI